MRVTFLIGNGFDINLGLNTRYKDFIDVYKKPNVNDDVVIKTFKNHLEENKENWSDAELAFGEYTYRFEKSEIAMRKFLHCHEDFCENLANYLNNESNRLKTSQTTGYKFMQCVNSILEQVGNLKREDLFELKNFTLKGKFNWFDFITFNYTTTLEKLIKEAQKYLENSTNEDYKFSSINSDVIHAHGFLNSTMVLGVNDDSQLCKELFEDYDKRYKAQVIKSNFPLISENDYIKEIKEKLVKSDIIYIYGMSLGETDKRWWQDIISILNKYEDKKLFIHCYDERHSFFGTLNKIEEEKIMNNFLKYSKCEQSTKEKLKKRIVIIRENIFEKLKDTIIYTKPSGKIHISDLI